MLKRTILIIFPLLAMMLPSVLAAQASGQPAGPSLGNWTPGKKEKPRDPTIRNLQGQVLLPDDKPAEGAVVKLKNLKTLQIRSYITQRDGKYVFQNLSRNVDYEIKSDFKDMSSPTRSLTVFDSRYDPVINLKLDASKAKAADKKDDKSE